MSIWKRALATCLAAVLLLLHPVISGAATVTADGYSTVYVNS